MTGSLFWMTIPLRPKAGYSPHSQHHLAESVGMPFIFLSMKSSGKGSDSVDSIPENKSSRADSTELADKYRKCTVKHI